MSRCNRELSDLERSIAEQGMQLAWVGGDSLWLIRIYWYDNIWYDIMAPIWDHVNTLLEMSTCDMGRKLRNLQLQHLPHADQDQPRPMWLVLLPLQRWRSLGTFRKFGCVTYLLCLIESYRITACEPFESLGLESFKIWFLSSSAENGGLAWSCMDSLLGDWANCVCTLRMFTLAFCKVVALISVRNHARSGGWKLETDTGTRLARHRGRYSVFAMLFCLLLPS